MKLHKFALTAIALLSVGTLTAGNAFAQDTTQRPNRANRQGGQQGANRQGGAPAIATAFKAISPTADQEVKFKALQESYQKDVAALRDVAREERREKTQAVNTKFQADVVALLTDEQKPKFEEELRKARQRRGGLMNTLEPLKLTDEQKKSIEPIAQDTQRKMTEIMRNQDVPQQERMAKITGLVDEFKSKVRPLLTETQQKDFDALNFRRAGVGGRGGAQGARPGRQRGTDAPPPPPVR